MLKIAKLSLLAVGGTGTGVVTLDSYNYINLTNYSVMRAARTGITTVKTIVDYKWSLMNLKSDSLEYDKAKSQAHDRAALRLLDLCWRNRGTFIKVGQHLGGMDYLLPQEYTRVLKVLHSNAPQSEIEELEQVVVEDLGVSKLSDLFSEFSEKPLGTASLAQVHKARLRDNNALVAVKIQHPAVRDLADKDMNMMDVAVKLVKWAFPSFELMWLTEETRKNLPVELDFTYEAKNCLEAAKNLRHFSWVKLPEIYWKYSTPRVMVMEFLEGGQINDCLYLHRQKIEFKDVARLLGKLFSEMIFVHGFVHCDPHPGNILVRRNTKKLSLLQKIFPFRGTDGGGLEILLLDHGLYRRLSEHFRYEYANLWQAIIHRDLPAMEKHAKALGSGELYPVLVTIVTGRAWQVVGEEGIQNVNFTKDEDDAIRDGASTFLPHISKVLGRMPSEMSLVLKTNDHLRGLEHMFGVRGHQSGFIDMSSCCLKALCDIESRRSTSILQRLKWRFYLYAGLASIYTFEWYLWFLDLINRSNLKSSIAFRSKQLVGIET